MYEEFFGLTEKPFSIQPDPSFLYWGRTHRLAYAMLEYGVLNHAGISVITGEVGCGKTTLVHRLLEQLSDTHTVSLLSNIQEGRGDLLSWVLMGFGQPFAGKTHVELFAQLQTYFIGEYAKGRRIILIIDEAQNLSMDMLEELRLLSNINAGKDQLLQLILVGQPELKGLLNKPELLQLAQRVGSDFHLTPLNKEEVHAYVETRLAIAGCKRRIFTDRAIDLIAEQSRGVPRVINIIADTALVYAFSAEDLVVGVETIRSVIRDKTDYGVFGIASNEPGAPPLKPVAGAGPDAFVSDTAEEKERGGATSVSGDKSKRKTPAPDKPPNSLEPNPEASKTPPSPALPSPQAAPAAKPAASLKQTAATPIAAPETEPAIIDRPVLTEATAITGIVVVGANSKISPEAAIRSAGDSRAIVFAPVGTAPEPLEIARRAGAVIVEGDERSLATGGRARNAGYRQLKKIARHIRYVQFIDSDYALDPDWVGNAEKFMERRPEVAIVEGKVQTQSGADIEYRTIAEQKNRELIGEVPLIANASVFMRTENFEAAGGFRGDLLVCETEDLCVRQRRRGGRVWRLDETMLICQSQKQKLGKWWSDSIRRGFENAYAASLHGGPAGADRRPRHGTGDYLGLCISTCYCRNGSYRRGWRSCFGAAHASLCRCGVHIGLGRRRLRRKVRDCRIAARLSQAFIMAESILCGFQPISGIYGSLAFLVRRPAFVAGQLGNVADANALYFASIFMTELWGCRPMYDACICLLLISSSPGNALHNKISSNRVSVSKSSQWRP